MVLLFSLGSAAAPPPRWNDKIERKSSENVTVKNNRNICSVIDDDTTADPFLDSWPYSGNSHTFATCFLRNDSFSLCIQHNTINQEYEIATAFGFGPDEPFKPFITHISAVS
jgi:hypothetical protein